MSAHLDQVDRRIISILQRDGRTANVEIARDLALSEGTVRKRLERLLEKGVLQVRGLIEPAHVGYATRALIGIEADLAQMEAIGAKLAELPQVASVYLVTGAYDIVIEVFLKSADRLLDFLVNEVASIAGVKRTETFHVLKVVRSPQEWLIPEEPTTIENP